MSLAYYRKYRPQTFTEIIGQDHIVNVLQKSLRNKKTHHAYLFVGSRGTGKTSTARILAKSLNCSKPLIAEERWEPCNKCFACVSITEGSYLDLLEIDAASNRGIDEIRDLREKIKLAPTEGKHKIYIIDEVHMLTNEAFNALLKTLEEPPPRAIFILCTTDPQKLPATIISRCLKLEFHQPTLADISHKLKRIIENEGVELSEESLEVISKAASGAFRDGEVLLEKAISELGEKIKEVGSGELEKAIGVINKDNQYKFISYLIDKDSSKALVWLDDFVKSGGDVKTFNVLLLEQIRLFLLASFGLAKMFADKVSPEVYDYIQTESNTLTQVEIIKMYEIFTHSLEQLKISPIPQLPLEIAVAEIISEDRKTTKVAKVSPEPAVVDEVIPVMDPPSDLFVKITAQWSEITKATKNYNNSLCAVLTSCEPKDFDGKILTLAFPYSFHKDRLEEAKNRKVVEKLISDIVGAEVKVKGTVEARKKRDMSRADIKNVEPVSEEKMLEKALDIFNSGLEPNS